MSEIAPHSTPDLEYASQLRFSGLAPEGSDKPIGKYSLDVAKIDSGGSVALPDGTRKQLDFIVNATHGLSINSSEIPGVDAKLYNALQAGNVLAGTNPTGEVGKTEMAVRSPEQFRAMVARAVGEAALRAYESELTGLQVESAADDSEITAEKPKLISTVVNVERNPVGASEPAAEVPVVASETEVVAEKVQPAIESDDGWVSFEESNPLPVREVAGIAQSETKDEPVAPEQTIGEIIDTLPERDRNQLERYALYARKKAENQLKGDGAGSLRCSEVMGDALKKMSPAAQKVANRYVTIYQEQREQPKSSEVLKGGGVSEATAEKPARTEDERQATIGSLKEYYTDFRRVVQASGGQDSEYIENFAMRQIRDFSGNEIPGANDVENSLVYAMAAGHVRSREMVHAAMDMYQHSYDKLLAEKDHEFTAAFNAIFNQLSMVGDMRFEGPQAANYLSENAEQVMRSLANQMHDPRIETELKGVYLGAVLCAEGLANSPSAAVFMTQNFDELLMEVVI